MSKLSSMFCAGLLLALVSCGGKKDAVGPNPPPPPSPAPPPPDVQNPMAAISSPSGGSYLTGMVAINVNAQDNVAVTRVELLVDGVVAATDNSAPWAFSWDTDLLDDGARNIAARAYDAAGNVGNSSAVPVNILHPFALSFRNSTYTDIALTVQNENTLTVPVGTVLTYTYSRKPYSLGFSGSTGVWTNQNTLIGLAMSWSDTYFSGSARADTVDLIVSGTYFFIKALNCGSTINGFYVNYGLVAQTYDNIAIPGDCVTHNVGYYRAYTNTQVRGYRSATTWTVWSQGVHFFLPFTNNQSVTLRNDFSGSAIVASADARVANPSRETLPQAVDLGAWLSAKPAARQFIAQARE